MRTAASILIAAICVVLWALTFLVMTTDAPLGRALIRGAVIGAAIGGITWNLGTKVSRRVRRLSLVLALLGFIFAVWFGPHVFVDTFDPKNPPTWLEVLVPNLIVALPYSVVPASIAILAGWAIGKAKAIC